MIAILLHNFLHSVSAPLRAITTMNFRTLEALLPRLHLHALATEIKVAQLPARVMTSSLICVEILFAAVADVRGIIVYTNSSIPITFFVRPLPRIVLEYVAFQALDVGRRSV